MRFIGFLGLFRSKKSLYVLFIHNFSSRLRAVNVTVRPSQHQNRGRSRAYIALHACLHVAKLLVQ